MIKKILLSFLILFSIFLVACEKASEIGSNTKENEEEQQNPLDPEPEPEPEPCKHEFKDGTCLICGYKCSHEWDNGKCTICGFKCSHTYYAEGHCLDCDYPVYKDCEHEWDNGTITKQATCKEEP